MDANFYMVQKGLNGYVEEKSVEDKHI